MITEDELSELLQRAADDVTVPKGGSSTIRTAAQSGAPFATRRRISPLRPRELAFAGGGVAAVAALIGVLLTVGGGVTPSSPARERHKWDIARDDFILRARARRQWC